MKRDYLNLKVSIPIIKSDRKLLNMMRRNFPPFVYKRKFIFFFLLFNFSQKREEYTDSCEILILRKKP
jgi:hypothetical protein